MRLLKVFLTALLVGLMVVPSWADNKAADVKKGPLVIGKDLKIGMSLEQAIGVLGTPKTIIVNRGTESIVDSITIEYPAHGVVIQVLTNKTSVEGIELLPSFKGTLADGIGLKSKFKDLIDKYGKPSVLSANDVRYPERGLFFFLKGEEVVAAKVFDTKTKLLDYLLLSK